MGETIRIVGPVATVKAITKAQARAVLATREVTTRVTTKGTTRAATTREAVVSVTTARHSLTRMAGHTEGAEGRLSFLQSKREGATDPIFF